MLNSFSTTDAECRALTCLTPHGTRDEAQITGEWIASDTTVEVRP